MSETTDSQLVEKSTPKRAHFFKDADSSSSLLDKGKVRTEKGERASSRLSKETKAVLQSHFEETVLAKDADGQDPDFVTIQTRAKQEIDRLREERNKEGVTKDTKRALRLAELSLQKRMEAALRNKLEQHLESSNSPWQGITEVIKEKVYATSSLQPKIVDTLVKQYVLSTQELIGGQLVALAAKDMQKPKENRALGDDSSTSNLQAAYDSFLASRMHEYLAIASPAELDRLREGGLNELTFQVIKNDNHRYSSDYFVNKSHEERVQVLREDIGRQLEHTALDMLIEQRAQSFEQQKAKLEKAEKQQSAKPSRFKRFFPSKATALRAAGAFAAIFGGVSGGHSTSPAFSDEYSPTPVTIQVDRPMPSVALDSFVNAPVVLDDETVSQDEQIDEPILPADQVISAAVAATQAVEKNIAQILAQRVSETATITSQEAKPVEAKVQGVFISTEKTQFFVPGSDAPIQLDTVSSQVQVKEMKETKDGDFRYLIDMDGKAYEVPVSQISLTEGTLTKEVVGNKNFGIRVHDREGVAFAKSLGATAVRIVPVDGRIDASGDLGEQNPREAIEEAEKQGMDILYVFNPDNNMTPEQIDEELKFLAKHKSIRVEIGNEPNLPQFWDGTIEDFAKFVKASSEKLWSIDPEKKIVVGALFDPTGISGPKTEEQVQELSDYFDDIGFDKKDPRVSYAIHEYNFSSYITDAIKLTKELFGDNIEITETGVDANAPESSKLFNDLLHTIDDANVPYFIHEVRFEKKRAIDPFTQEHLSIVDEGDFRVEMMRANNAKEGKTLLAKTSGSQQH